MLVLPVEYLDAWEWFRFEQNDARLLQSIPTIGYGSGQAGFIVSINSPYEVRKMLKECGRLIAECEISTFVYRTNHLSVLGWATRFQALVSMREGHRARFLMQSREWNNLCVTAYEARNWQHQMD